LAIIELLLIIIFILVIFFGSSIPVKAELEEWSYLNSMNEDRYGSTTTLLNNGKVLVVGGTNSVKGKLSSAEVYDPLTNKWSFTGSMNSARSFHNAVLLSDGKVLISGGDGINNTPISSAEIYDPITGEWSITGSMVVARTSHTMTLLTSNKVLITGGFSFGLLSDTAEIYDIESGLWALTNPINRVKKDHQATLLPNGNVLITGGYTPSDYITEVEIFDYLSETWTDCSPMNTARRNHSATLLENGEILVAGGDRTTNSTAELYDPITNTWTTTGSLNTNREGGQSATLLLNGKFLITGGYDAYTNTFTDNTELYDPSTGLWEFTGSMNSGRFFSNTVLLQDGNLMVVGGASKDTGIVKYLDSTEIYKVPLTVRVDQSPHQQDPTNSSPIEFIVKFSKPVIGFDNSDISFLGSTVPGTLVATISGSGPTYTVSVSGMSGNGSIVVSIPPGVVIDSSGNTNPVSTSTDNSVYYDAPPTVTINQALVQSDPVNSGPIYFTVTFSELVTGFSPSDISFEGSTAPGPLSALISGTGTAYTISVSGMSDSGTIMVSIPEGSVQDSFGSGNSESTSSDNVVTYDITPPDVTINKSIVQSDPTNTSPIKFTVDFSEPISGFESSDISLVGSTVPGDLDIFISGSGSNFTIVVFGMTGSGNLEVSIPTNVVHDLAGNSNNASTSSDNVVTYDITPPTVVINQSSGQLDPTNASPILFSVIFSESVTGFSSSDISFTGSTDPDTLNASISGTGPNYTVSVTGMVENHTVMASIPANSVQDNAGNFNLVSSSTDNSVYYDAPPSVTINQSSEQTDPVNSGPLVFDVTFSEPVFGFTNSDISFTGSTTPGTLIASISGSGPTYTISVFGMTGNGIVVATIPEGVVQDSFGSPNSASTSMDNIITFDITPPSVTVNQSIEQPDPTSTSPIVFTVKFSESVIGFTNSDVSFVGSSAPGALVASISGSGSNYTISVSGMTDSGTVVASILPNAVEDLAGNFNTQSTSTDNSVTFDINSVSVTIDQAALQTDPTNSSPIEFSVLFSDSVTGFTSSDISFSGSTVSGSLSASITGSGASYKISVTGMTGTGYVIVSIPEDSVQNSLGNPNSKSTNIDNSVYYDVTPPSVSINVLNPNLSMGSTSEVIFTFSEEILGFTIDAITVENGTIKDLETTDNITWAGLLIPTSGISDPSNYIEFQNNVIQDLAGNFGSGTSYSNQYSIQTLFKVFLPTIIK